MGVTADNIVRYKVSPLTEIQHSLIQPFYSDFGNNFEMHCVFEPPTSSKEMSTLCKFNAERLRINKKRNESTPCQVKTFYLDFHQISRVFNVKISLFLSLFLMLHAYPFHNALSWSHLQISAYHRLPPNFSILHKIVVNIFATVNVG